MTDQGTIINLKSTGGGQGGGQKDDSAYKIPGEVLKKYPDLVALIKAAESMNDQERNYWFQILPIMTDKQVDKLRNILAQEKEQLAKLDAAYEQKIQKLNDKHMAEWRELESKKVREERQAAESASEAQEAKAEEDILGQLDEV
ncbi:MAG: hypothetical protein ABII07_06170 [Patescibacteria group bacterium]|nr:hypothetical protein [Patescibacteria group bacterium]